MLFPFTLGVKCRTLFYPAASAANSMTGQGTPTWRSAGIGRLESTGQSSSPEWANVGTHVANGYRTEIAAVETVQRVVGYKPELVPGDSARAGRQTGQRPAHLVHHECPAVGDGCSVQYEPPVLTTTVSPGTASTGFPTGIAPPRARTLARDIPTRHCQLRHVHP